MSIRPGKYIEYDFPLHEVNRLAVKEANAKKPIYTMHKWWARRLSCVFRTILLGSRIDWEDWDRLEPWIRDADGDFIDAEGQKITDERQYHRRVRDEGVSPEWNRRTNGLLDRSPSAWERLYYRLDPEANGLIRWAFTQPKGGEADTVRLAEHLSRLGTSPTSPSWWEKIDLEQREPVTILDPFMGGGTTIVESLRLGANPVGVDLNPVAWFVVKKETDGCDLNALEAAFRQVEATVAEDIKRFYRTQCPCCGEQADVMYVFWVKLAPCSEQTCGATVPLYNSFVIAKRSGGKTRPAPVPSNDKGVQGMQVAEGPERGLLFIKCPNADCGEVYASRERGHSTCPACGITFDPEQGYAGNGKYTCPDCGGTHQVLEAAEANIPPGMAINAPLPYRMFAIELHCPQCGYKGYKNASVDDQALFEAARTEFEANRDSLGYPTQEIPPGYNTFVGNPLPQHGLHYWHQMFSERQLLCLCRLRDAICQVDDKNVKEYLIQGLSACLPTYTTFAFYCKTTQKIQWMWTHHAFVPRMTYCENNLWGGTYGRGTFVKQLGSMRAALAWATQTTDAFYTSGDAHGVREVGDAVVGHGRGATLSARSAENLDGLFGAQKPVVGSVITDPPYYGNVMYSELSDFHYVWLRTALVDEHQEEFAPLLTPKDEEVVEQVTRGHGAAFLHKDKAFFISGLTRIFAEAGRYLQPLGLLVFTFHHQANEAWASVLQTVLDAGYVMVSVFPVHAETLQSLHIQSKKNISYDAVIVCRKQDDQPRQLQWEDLSDAIYGQAERLVRELEARHDPLPPEDIYVIVVGKCMQVYSQHYWRGQSCVLHRGETVSIEEALDGNDERCINGIGEIVDQLVEESEGRMWPSGLDPVSRFYLINFLGQTEVPYDRLHRRLRHNAHLSLELLERRQLVKQAKGKVKVLTEREREEYLTELVSSGHPEQLRLDIEDSEQDGLTIIDKIHYLTLLDQQGVMTGGLLARWSADPVFVETLSCITRFLDPSATSYKSFKRLAEQAGGQMDLF